jgi:hypothetical protein
VRLHPRWWSAATAVLAVTSLPDAGRAQSAAFAAVPAEDRTLAERTRTFLLGTPSGTPVIHLDAAAIDSVGTAMSERNLALAWAVEDAYRSGRYGAAGADSSRTEARAAYMYHAIYSTSEKDLRAAFTERFRNPGLYPIVDLKDFRAGFGRFCMEFEVDDRSRREIRVTGETMRAWTEETEIGGRRERVVNIDMNTLSHDRVHLLYRRYATGTVHEMVVHEDGTPIQVATMEDVSGQFVRKWGLHRPEAVVLWKSVADGLDAPPRGRRYLGSAIYFPGLQLKLPWFLPNLGFDDLRRFDFPQPLLTMEDVLTIRDRNLDWLRVQDNLRFDADWEGEGDVPEFVRGRFPDD